MGSSLNKLYLYIKENVIEKKIKMLVIPSDRSGCGFFRSVQPHVYIAEHYSNEFEIDIVYEFPKNVELDKYS